MPLAMKHLLKTHCMFPASASSGEGEQGRGQALPGWGRMAFSKRGEETGSGNPKVTVGLAKKFPRVYNKYPYSIRYYHFKNVTFQNTCKSTYKTL